MSKSKSESPEIVWKAKADSGNSNSVVRGRMTYPKWEFLRETAFDLANKLGLEFVVKDQDKGLVMKTVYFDVIGPKENTGKFARFMKQIIAKEENKDRKCDKCREQVVPDPIARDHQSADAFICPVCCFTPEAMREEFERMYTDVNSRLGNLKFKSSAPKKKYIPLATEAPSERSEYLSDVLDFANGDESAFRDDIFSLAPDSFRYHAFRPRFVFKYAWSIPHKKALEVIASHGPIVEIGAGNGYWAYLLANMGVDVVAYDIATDSGMYGGTNSSYWKLWFEVEKGDERMAAKYKDRSLFLCWPAYNSPMAEKALKSYKGDTVIYIGEDKGGCTANDKFFVNLEKNFDEVESIELHVWPGIHDRLYIFKRK